MSLKSSLNQIIKDRNGGIFTLKELRAYCDQAKYKQSNAERRLRRSESPDVESVYNEKHTAIIGYRWAENEEIIEPEPIYNFNGVLISAKPQMQLGLKK